MKVQPDLIPTDIDAPANELSLPNGIIGFSDRHRAELLYLPDNLPFLWMKLWGADPRDKVQFIVIEPGGVIPGYEPELYDVDAEHLGIGRPADAMILNIVTLKRVDPVEATVNLIGPIVVNRQTRVARQVVISNYSRYTTNHPLVERSQSPAVGAMR